MQVKYKILMLNSFFFQEIIWFQITNENNLHTIIASKD